MAETGASYPHLTLRYNLNQSQKIISINLGAKANFYKKKIAKVDIAVFRDLDSRLSEREACVLLFHPFVLCRFTYFSVSKKNIIFSLHDHKAAAVKEWVNSEDAIHIMRDHPHVRKSSADENMFSTKQL